MRATPNMAMDSNGKPRRDPLNFSNKNIGKALIIQKRYYHLKIIYEMIYMIQELEEGLIQHILYIEKSIGLQRRFFVHFRSSPGVYIEIWM